ncbi:protein of unknown function DUF366 [Methanohalobium evestigatum Z-7303]|uniref:DUF366 domain-containing protein n=1 Tax=Methanohalobium evestigatum (strain ATCC BAA-1072 / DSM 3721 / NBRC 107634 / OCM 161 / Z-7303) TaxID=644295 RepID=D7E940_METEZ|nr:DUF366 family protein [Methanohalobium evestigatum]ADI73988.1 protein of unknown function DUF366 [Methanohalobium evestigatum Z-7303]
MECIYLNNRNYDGSQISSLWAYNIAGVQDDSIIYFRGTCNVEIDHMIDLEDKRENEAIYSSDMIHFIIEHFDSTNLKLVYSRQRLFASIVSEILMDKGFNIKREGDDLFINNRKLSVSIASTSAVSQKIHFGINVIHDYYADLKSIGFEESKIEQLMCEIAESYVNELDDIEKDLRKSRPLDVI